MVTIKRGFEFTHERLLDPQWAPDLSKGEKFKDAPKARMAVTRVTRDTVWYDYAANNPRKAGFRMDRSTFEERYIPQDVPEHRFSGGDGDTQYADVCTVCQHHLSEHEEAEPCCIAFVTSGGRDHEPGCNQKEKR